MESGITYDIFYTSTIGANPDALRHRFHNEGCVISFYSMQNQLWTQICALKMEHYILRNEIPTTHSDSVAKIRPMMVVVLYQALIDAGRLDEANQMFDKHQNQCNFILFLQSRSEQLVKDWDEKLLKLLNNLFMEYFGSEAMGMTEIKPYLDERNYYGVWWQLNEIMYGKNTKSIADIVSSKQFCMGRKRSIHKFSCPSRSLG